MITNKGFEVPCSSALGQADVLPNRAIFERSVVSPEDPGKLSFYLEALDSGVRKEHEKPSVGVLSCKSKDYEVVEYAT